MERSLFTKWRAVHALRQADAGAPAVEVYRELGVGEQTFSRWTRRFAGLGIAEPQRLRKPEYENGKPKRLVDDLSLGDRMLQKAL